MVISSSSMERTAQVAAKIDANSALDDLVEDGTKTAEEAAVEKEQPSRKKWRVNMRVLMLGLLLAALVMAALRALSEQGWVAWLFAIPTLPKEVGDIAVVLGPLLAVSVAVERLLERGGFD